MRLKEFLGKQSILNVIAEFFGTFIYVLLFFIFVSRYNSSEYQFDFIELSYFIGFAFIVAVYIPFYTYRIHILPFFSIVSALRRKSIKLFIQRICAQVLGALSASLVFNYLALHIFHHSSLESITDVFQLTAQNNYVLAFYNFLLCSVLCFLFYVVRILFKANTFVGTIFIGLVFSICFFMTGTISGTSVLNPFGYLFLMLINGTVPLLSFSTIVAHIIAPLSGALIVHLYMLNKFGENNYIYHSKTVTNTEEIEDAHNLDI